MPCLARSCKVGNAQSQSTRATLGIDKAARQIFKALLSFLKREYWVEAAVLLWASILPCQCLRSHSQILKKHKDSMLSRRHNSWLMWYQWCCYSKGQETCCLLLDYNSIRKLTSLGASRNTWKRIEGWLGSCECEKRKREVEGGTEPGFHLLMNVCRISVFYIKWNSFHRDIECFK